MPIAAGGTRKRGETAIAPATSPASLRFKSVRMVVLVGALLAKLAQCASQSAQTPVDDAASAWPTVTCAAGTRASPASPPTPMEKRATANRSVSEIVDSGWI